MWACGDVLSCVCAVGVVCCQAGRYSSSMRGKSAALGGTVVGGVGAGIATASPLKAMFGKAGDSLSVSLWCV